MMRIFNLGNAEIPPSPVVGPSCPFLPLWLSIAVMPALGAEGPSPADFVLHSELRISVFAQEPQVVDPVALTFDADGVMYVVEMRDYPLGLGPERKPGGTVRRLSDDDGDGRADRSTIFAEGLSFPTSILAWRDGVLVTAPPEILYLKDSDADGRADVREVVLKGFVLGVTDSNVNGLRWALDNRVHGANGGNDGTISSPRQPGVTINLRNLDFCFNPDTGELGATYHTGAGFGLVMDEWGRSFTTYNINHLQHRVIPARYLQRFSGLAPVTATESISDHGEMARIYPIAVAQTRVNHPEQAGYFSAAGGMGYIGWDGYSQDLTGSLLVCDVVGHLVHRDVLKEIGPSFVARRAASELEKEFFASRDLSCRPVGVELGPDGALYLIDMQREVIEHPDYIPKKARETLQLRAGEDRGRIYRLAPKNRPLERNSKWSTASTEVLVGELGHPNLCRRLTAQRLIYERRDPVALPGLKAMVQDVTSPLGRLHALWALHGLNSLEEREVLSGLSDSHPGIRENSLVMAESFLPGSNALRERILDLASDHSPRVRFQAALSLGQFDHPQRLAALEKVLRQDYEYRWTRLAALSSMPSGSDQVLASLLSDSGFTRETHAQKVELIRELSDLSGARLKPNDPSLLRLLDPANLSTLSPPWRIALLTGLRTGVVRTGGASAASSEAAQHLEAITLDASPDLLNACWQLARALHLPALKRHQEFLTRAAELALDTGQAVNVRAENIRLLGQGPVEDLGLQTTLLACLKPLEPTLVQVAAIETLRQNPGVEVARQLVQRWRSFAPSLRLSVIEILLQRRGFHPVLLEAVETGAVHLGELNLDLEQRRQLLRHSTPEVRARAARLFGDEEYSNRQAVVEQWLKRLPPNGQAERGREVFAKTCAQCHRSGDLGAAVGPDLQGLAHRSVEDLASNILDPNMAINPNLDLSYACCAKDLKSEREA